MSRLCLLVSVLIIGSDALAMGGLLKNVFQSPACVGDFMAKDVLVLEADDRLQDAAQVLVAKRVRGAPVVDGKDRQLVGVLSQVDFLYRTAGYRTAGKSSGARSERIGEKAKQWKKIEAETVREAMTPNPITVTPETSMKEAANILVSKKLGRLIVVDDEGCLVGLLSCTDMMDLVVQGELDMLN